jgi:predicted SAM-dependent methyltransferase
MLRECIDSILAQTRPVQEILVVNDGSTDDTIDVIQSYGDRLTLFNKTNGGKSSALNLALKHCQSDYVWICDDDDLAAPDGVKDLANALDLNEDMDFAFGTYQFFRNDKGNHFYYEVMTSGLEYEPNVCLRFLEEMFTYQYAMLARRSLYERVGPFREDLIRAQDYDMCIRLARSFKGVHVPKVIFYARDHDGVRGSAADVILPEDRVRRQFIYDQKIFSWVKQEFHIHEFTPTFALKWDQALAERAALLERACVFAAHAMWDDAFDNFRQAGQSSTIPAKSEELKLAERVIKDENAWGALFGDPIWCTKFRICYQSNEYCRKILRATCSPVVRRVRHFFLARSFYEGIMVIKALCRILGIRGGLLAGFGEMLKAAPKCLLGNRLLGRARLRRQISRSFGRLDHDIAARYLAQSKEPKLHIGCGDHALPGWLNTDHFPNTGGIMHLDATRPFPFNDDTFDYVFSEHMIEHIPYRDGLKMLAECHRVLKPSGKIRISTPNLAFLIGLARTNKSDLECAYINWASRTFIDGAPEDNETFVINNFVRDWGHTFIYDEKTLRGAMTSVGFAQITKFDLQESHDVALRDLENETRIPPGFLRLETLSLEGTK